MKNYTTVLTQESSTSNVEASFLVNEIGNIQWEAIHDGVNQDGVYEGTLPNAFPEGKTTVDVFYLSDDMTQAPAGCRIDESTIRVKTGQVGLWNSLGVKVHVTTYD